MIKSNSHFRPGFFAGIFRINSGFLKMKLKTCFYTAFVGAFLSFCMTAFAAGNSEWKTWHDEIRGKNGVLKVKYQICSDSKFNFEVYRNKDWDGNKNSWEKIDSFAITPKNTSHKKDFPKFYSSIIGDIVVHYEIKADFKKNKVHSKGHIIAPLPNTFPVRTQKQQWDQDFFEIPSSKNIITTTKGDYSYVEVSEIWTALCSRIACGPWVQFPGYSETHRYNAFIPKVGPVIIQLWKGFCPNFGETSKEYKLTGMVNLINLGSEFPGGIGAEVGIYRPVGKNATMYDAATRQNPIGIGEWEPVVDPDLKISFQLVDPNTGEILVDAEEKNSWWRTKWMTAKSFEAYKRKHAVPSSVASFNFEKPLGKIPPADILKYELRYKINGVEQVPWKDPAFPGHYPEIGFNGIWRIRDYIRYLNSPRAFEVLQIYNDGKELEVSIDKMGPIKVPMNGKAVKGSDLLGNFELSARQSGKDKERITLEFKYNKEEFDLKKDLIAKNRASLPKIKGQDKIESQVNASIPDIKHGELEYKHSLELEILLPSHSIAVHGIFPGPLVYDPL